MAALLIVCKREIVVTPSLFQGFKILVYPLAIVTLYPLYTTSNRYGKKNKIMCIRPVR